MPIRALRTALLGVTVVVLSGHALGANAVWNQKGTAWEDPANWSAGQVPGPDDIAAFPGLDEAVKNQPTVSGIVHVGGIRLDNGHSGKDKIVLPGYEKITAAEERTFTYPPTSVAWIICGSGKIIVGKDGVSVARGSSIIYPSLELAQDQTWNLGSPSVVRAGSWPGYMWRAYWKKIVRYWNMYQYYGDPSLMVFGVISGPGNLTKCGRGSIYYVSDHCPTFRGGTVVREGLITWRPLRPGDYAFGAGPLDLDGGSFCFAPRFEAGEGQSRLENPIRVMSHGGEIQSRWHYQGKWPKGDVHLTGPLEVGGFLRSSLLDPGMTFDNPQITILQGEPASPGIACLTDANNSYYWSMPIVDGPGSAGNPLILQYQPVLSLFGPGNRYAGPTVVSFSTMMGCYLGVINVGPQCQLGQGDVIIEPGGRMQLSAAGNLDDKARAVVQSNRRALGVLGVAYNGIPKISDDSEGVLAVDCADFDAVTDLSKLGGGRMYLGARDRGAFTGTKLARGAGGVYRLGGGHCGGPPGIGWPPRAGILASGINAKNTNPWNRSPGGGLLTIENPVLKGNADVVVGAVCNMGTGAVLLKSPQSFTGRLTVQGPNCTSVASSFFSRGSFLEGWTQNQPGQSPFGSPEGPVCLLNSTLKLTGTAGGQPVSKGELAYVGQCNLCLDAGNDHHPTTLNLAKLTRNGRAALTIEAARGSLGEQEKLLVSAWKTDVDLLPPYYLAYCRTGGFLSYDAAHGKGLRPYTAYVTDLAKATAKDVVKLGKGILPGGGHSVRALSVEGLVTGTDRIRIVSGGLSLGGDLSADINFGQAEGVIYQSNSLQRNRAEGSAVTELKGRISGANGITIVGGPDLIGAGFDGIHLSNTRNDFQGPITINGGVLCAVQDLEQNGRFTPGSLGDLKNEIVLNGGIICWSAKDIRWLAGGPTGPHRCIAPSRKLYLGPGGGCLGGSLAHQSMSPLFIYAKITGPGFFTQWFEAGGLVYITNPENDYSGGTWIGLSDDQGMETIVTETGKLGTGPVLVSMDCGLILQGDKNINPGARLNLAYAGVVMFESPRPIIGSLDGCGQIFLGVQNAAAEVHDGYHLPAVAGHDTTLVLGADNTDAAFYGTIRQAGDRTGDGIGSLVKTGKGVFTLYGGHTYTGPTTVEQGTLDLRGGLAGGVLVKPEGTLKGTGRIADGLRLEGTLTVDACGPTGQPLQVAGAAKLRGSLQVTTPHDSAPAASRKWTVLAAQGGITGHVDQVTKGYQASIAADGKRLEVERLAR